MGWARLGHCVMTSASQSFLDRKAQRLTRTSLSKIARRGYIAPGGGGGGGGVRKRKFPNCKRSGLGHLAPSQEPALGGTEDARTGASGQDIWGWIQKSVGPTGGSMTRPVCLLPALFPLIPDACFSVCCLLQHPPHRRSSSKS